MSVLALTQEMIAILAEVRHLASDAPSLEFLQQGIRQHGMNWVGAVVALKKTAVVRINPAQDAFCPKCSEILVLNHNYGMYSDDGTLIYGCCSGGIGLRPPVFGEVFSRLS